MYFFMAGQYIANSLPSSEQDIDHPRRKDILRQRGKFKRRQRRDFRRLNHHAVTCRQRGRQLPGRHHERIIPRRDRGNHANRVPADHRRMSFQIFARRQSTQTTGRASKKAKDIHDCRNFIIDYAVQRLTAVLRFQPGKLKGVLLDAVRQF